MHPKRTALAALVLGIMISPLNSVFAQAPPVSGQVEIQASSSKAPSTGIEQPKMINHRDPFVKGYTPPPPQPNYHARVPDRQDQKPGPSKPAAFLPPIEVPAPQVTIHGIISSNSGNRAILASPNKTYLVQRGDKLGDYTVESVNAKTVVFRYKDKTFNLKLESEFGSVAAAQPKKR